MMASKFDKMEMPKKKMAESAEPTEIKLEIGEGEDMEDDMEAPAPEMKPGKDIPSMVKELEAMGYVITPPAEEVEVDAEEEISEEV